VTGPTDRAAETGPTAPRPRNVLVRAVLTSLSLVALAPVAVVVGGGFFPTVPVIGPFGAFLNAGLPWLLGSAVIASGLVGMAVSLGGRKAIVLLGLCLVVLGGTMFVVYRYATFATENGASFDLVRAIDGGQAARVADTRVVFATVDGLDLHADLWLPRGGPSPAPAASHPVVVYVHGGAFVGGELGSRPALFAALADAGIVVVDVEYRLSPPPRWDQAPGDALCALSWLETAPELDVADPGRVVVMGESAGASLALLAGYAAGTEALASSCPGREPTLVPAGVVAVSPAADLEGIWEDATLWAAGVPFPEAYIGGSPAEYPQRYEAASPFRILRADLPPTLILTGETDRLVRLQRVISVADRINAAGSDCELLVAPFAGHGFDGEVNSFGAQVEEQLVVDFVARVAG
jgi:acetyl esterase/lipase